MPASWKVSGDEGVIEIHPGASQGVLHFSFLRKQVTSPPSEDAACAILENFAKNNDLELVGRLERSRQDGGVAVFGSYTSRIKAEVPQEWEVGCVSWEDAAVRGSWIHESRSDEIREQARTVFRSIERVREGQE